MGDDATNRLALPLLSAGQAQKEVTHNEAIARLDLFAQAVVAAVGLDTPPGAPEPGQCWIIGAAPTGEWSGRAHTLAGWTTGGWRFLAPFEGLAAWSIADTAWVRYAGSGWRIGVIQGAAVEIAGDVVLGARRGAIGDPAGGATVDGEARTAVAAILAAMREHGLIAS